jgi:hypothetical protein
MQEGTMANKSGLNVKQLLLQKGERIGLGAAAGLLVVFLVLGGIKAASSASPSGYTTDIDGKIRTAESKIQTGGGSPPELDAVVTSTDPRVPHIDFTRYPTPNEYFNGLGVEMAKRLNPKILPVSEAKAEVIHGSTGQLDIFEGPDGKLMVLVVVNRKPSAMDQRRIKELVDKKIQRRDQFFKSLMRQAGLPVGQPGTQPGTLPGGLPGARGGFPGGAPGGGFPGGGPPMGGAPTGGGKFGRGEGGGMGGPGGMGQQGEDTEVQPIELDKLQVDQARLAEALRPLRMVVVTGSVPYKAQVEEYQRALRKQYAEELQATNELPWYHSYNVERQVLSADGQQVLQDWTKLDLKATLGELFAKAFELEDDYHDYKAVKDDPKLASFIPYVVPDEMHELVVPRPKLVRGQYGDIDLKTIEVALKKLQEQGGVVELRSQLKQKLENAGDLIFSRGGGQQQGGFGGPEGMPGGVPGPGMPGGGLGGKFQPGTGGIPGRGTPPGGIPGRFVPPGGLPSGVPGGVMPGGVPGAIAGMQQQQQSPEEAWLMRFLDVTVRPGYCYKYRVQLKAHNPNFKKPVQTLAYPRLAEEEDLKSAWFELPDLVRVPAEEYIYAAAKDESKGRVTEKVPTGNQDETYVQMHRWFEHARPEGASWETPLGEWMIADLKAVRGQLIGETVRIKLPAWSMTHAMFQFRENAKSGPQRSSIYINRVSKAEPVWLVDFKPSTETLVVDFEGGNGPYVGPRRTVYDTAAVEMLLLTDDGKLKTGRIARSDRDLVDPARDEREKKWFEWLRQVGEDTLSNRQQQPGGPAGPGGAPGGGSRDS